MKYTPLIAIAFVAILVLGTITFFRSNKSSSNEPQKTEVTVQEETVPLQTEKELFAQGLSPQIQDSSIWKSTDEGYTFSVQSKAATGSAVVSADVLSVSFHPKDPESVVVGTVNNGIFWTKNGGDTWSSVYFPPKRIYSFILDQKNPDSRMFATGVTNNYGRIYRTTDGGKNWRAMYSEPGQSTIVTSLSQHFMNKDIVFAGTSKGTVIKSSDGGDTWKNVGGVVVKGNVSGFAFDAKKEPSMYLITYSSKIYYSPDGGISWIDWEAQKKKEVDDLRKEASALSSSRKAEANALKEKTDALVKRNQTNKMPPGIISLAADTVTSGTIYVGTLKGLYRSTDYGKYWYEVNIIESAKEFPIRSIAIHPKNAKEIVFVSGRSFYKSKNYGDTWAITALDSSRDPSIVTYNPLNPKQFFIGISAL